MKKLIGIFLLIFSCFTVFSQKKTNTTKAKDTIKTEVINVITSYTPTIADAFKARKNPKIKLSDRSKKKKLDYTIFSAPVASTFIPKTGVVKGIDVGVKERLYNNYLAAGFGNNTTPFVEVFLHKSTRFKNDFGVYAKYISSENSIETTPLSSFYSNLSASAYYKQKERYFDWKIGVNSKIDLYNWYGLPNSITFSNSAINNIQETQKYKLFEVEGALVFESEYFKNANVSLSFFSDAFSSSETIISLSPNFEFPLKSLGRRFNNLQLNTSINYLKGEFNRSYANNIKINYDLFTLNLNPVYRLEWNDFKIKAGAKLAASVDSENEANNIFVYPDVEIIYPLVKDYADLFIGASGNLHDNSFQKLTDINPFISPTLFITQTHEKYNAFGGIKGKLSTNVSFNLKGSYKTEEDKVLFVRNNSKSDGTANANLLGYEYGNSFGLVYDDVQTVSIFGELEIDVTKRIALGINAQFDSFTLTNQQEAWNLPELKGNMYLKYKNSKWFMSTDIFYVGERKDLLYTGTSPSTTNGIQSLEAYVDININGGYHFNDKFSAFLNVNNVLNNEYQRFSNFTVQGLQVLGGITYKFDF
jgi:hypothetical protein